MFSVIFPGQGSQLVGMGKEFFEKYDLVKKLFREADEVLDLSLSKIILFPKESITAQFQLETILLLRQRIKKQGRTLVAWDTEIEKIYKLKFSLFFF